MQAQTPDNALSAVRGAMCAGLAAMVAFAGEELILVVAGEAAQRWDHALTFVVLQAAVVFGLALVLSGLGLRGVRLGWAVWGTCCWGLVAGKLSAWHLDAWASAAAAVVIFAGVLGVTRLPNRWAESGLVGASVAMVAGFTLNLSVFGSVTAPAAVIADLAVIAVGALIAALPLRPTLWHGVLALAVLVGVRVPVGAWPSEQVEGSADAPLIVLVVIDTLRADHLGTYGYARQTSPGLDRLAARGLVFEQAQSAAPWTLPAFASLLTGLIPSDHGAGVNSGRRNTEAALGDVTTVAERLGAVGYGTVAVVSNPYLKRAYGLDRGFDVYDDALGVSHMPLLAQPLRLVGWSIVRGREYRRAPEMADRAIELLRGRQTGVFALVHFMDPHAPYRPDPVHVRGQRPVDLYDAEIRTVDDALTRLVAALPDDAWVIVTSDHGEEFGDHPAADSAEVPAGTRHGHTMYQELLHVPLVIVGPGLAPGRVETPVGARRIAPTILRLAGLDFSGGLAHTPIDPAPSPIVSESIRFGAEQKAVRLGRFKSIHLGRRELFDLERDADEQDDLTGTDPALWAEMAGWLPSQTIVGVEVPPSDAMLEALGYADPR
jgi:arylsulfatase